MKIKVMLLVFLVMYIAVSPCIADECAGSSAGSGLAASNTALIVWAKTIDDTSTFPSWASTLPSTFVDFFSVMSYDQYTIIPKIATKNGDFYVSDAGHSVDYYKAAYASLATGHHYLGPYGIFVEEILNKVENDYGADYFDDVDMITMMLTNGGVDWYLPSGNFTGVGYLGTDYTAGNGTFFDRCDGGVNAEFSGGENTTEWNICHEYAHYLGLIDVGSSYGTYSLMYNRKVNDSSEGVTPLSIDDIVELGWLDLNNASRVQTVTSNTSVTLKPVRSTTGVVAAKINLPGSTNVYFLINNHRQFDNPYDGTYPASGLLIWHVTTFFPSGSSADLECAVALDPITKGFNFDHLDLDKSDPNYYGEGLATDFHKATNKTQFTPWTNPNSDRLKTVGNTGIAIVNIRESGDDRIVDIDLNFHSGHLTEDSWWKGSETITGFTTISSGVTLTVNPLVVLPNAIAIPIIGFAPGTQLKVNGTLTVDGTSVSPVIFDRSVSKGTWDGIQFNSGSSGTITNAIINNATIGVHVVGVDDVTIGSCSIRNFTEKGVYLDNSSATVQNCTITGGINASHGIYATGDNSNPTIINNTINGEHIGIERSGNPGLATIRDNNISSEWIGAQNYPNPFNSRTKIRFPLPSLANVSLAIYNIRGSLIQELVRGQVYDSGWVEVPWDGTNRAGLPVSSGVYFYRLEAQGVDSQARIWQTRKLLLVR